MPLRKTLILAVLIAGLLGNTRARANPVVAYAAEFVLQYLGGKALDSVWNRRKSNRPQIFCLAAF